MRDSAQNTSQAVRNGGRASISLLDALRESVKNAAHGASEGAKAFANFLGAIRNGAHNAFNAITGGARSADQALDQMRDKTNEASKAMQSAGKNFETLAGKWRGAIMGLVRSVAAPIAGAFAMGSTINSYFLGVAQVAQMTGAYSTKLEEWRKKRALLARVNKEDIEMYKKGREALTRFNITMADLSTGIMRMQMPAIKFLIDLLNKFSGWIERNQPNIIRFLQITAGVITAMLIPSFIKLGIAMATNPLTWIIAAIGLLVIVIDDLVTYIHGGESAFGGLWSIVGDGETWLKYINTTLDVLGGLLKQLAPALIAFGSAFAVIKTGTTIISGVTSAVRVLQAVIMANPIGLAISAAIVAVTLLYQNWDKVVAGFKKGVAWFKEAFPGLTSIIENIVDAVAGLGRKIAEIFSFDNIKAKIADLVNWIPDWAKTDSMKQWAENTAKNKPDTTAASDQQIVSNSSNSTRNQNINNNNNVNIYTNSNDPKAVGQEVQSAMMQANNNNATQVALAESGVR